MRKKSNEVDESEQVKKSVIDSDQDGEEIGDLSNDDGLDGESEEEGSGYENSDNSSSHASATSDEESDELEEQGSSSEEDDDEEGECLQHDSEESDIELEESTRSKESDLRQWSRNVEKQKKAEQTGESGSLTKQKLLNVDDLSSDDEVETGNTVGRVPLHWYDAYDHIGYDQSGSKVVKRRVRDRLDKAISARDDPNSQRTVYDMYNDREIILSDRDLEIIRRLQGGAFAHPEFDDTPEYVDYVSGIPEEMPIYAAPEPKRRFVASKWELMKITQIVKAMKEGTYKSLAEIRDEKKNSRPKDPYMVWNDAEDEVLAETRRYKYHLPAPKMPLPGHAESYNPPTEYLLSEKERDEMDSLDPSERPYNFNPTKFSCLRHVPGYSNFIKERFERCLDLYLCPRKMKRRLNIDPESLVPSLPKPRELKPFPNSLCLQYIGHSKAVRAISVSPDGQYLATASEDCTIRLWEVDTSLCVNTWQMHSPVTGVSWNPVFSHHVLAAIVSDRVLFITTGTGNTDCTELTESLLSSAIDTAKKRGQTMSADSTSVAREYSNDDFGGDDTNGNGVRESGSNWVLPSESCKQSWLGSPVGSRVELKFPHAVKDINWHHKGDYLVVLTDSSSSSNITVHQLSKARSQTPFSKSPGSVQALCFHPSRPYLFVATQQHVKVYHLVEQKIVKKIITGCKWLSSIDIHPSGDHIILGSYDRRVVWLDLDMSATPYKTLKYHEKAIRGVNFHTKYPLMVSGSDDGNVHVFHSAVYSDMSRSPLIVPLKILKGHGVVGGLGVLDVVFHPKQPWVFSAGADGVVNLFQDV